MGQTTCVSLKTKDHTEIVSALQVSTTKESSKFCSELRGGERREGESDYCQWILQRGGCKAQQ